MIITAQENEPRGSGPFDQPIKVYMSHLDVRVHAQGEEFPLPEFIDCEQLEFKAAVVVEKATLGGRTGVMLMFEDSAGKKFYAQTTARMIANGLAGAVKGAAVRFHDNLAEA